LAVNIFSCEPAAAVQHMCPPSATKTPPESPLTHRVIKYLLQATKPASYLCAALLSSLQTMTAQVTCQNVKRLRTVCDHVLLHYFNRIN
jgi:hypothetical protein